MYYSPIHVTATSTDFMTKNKPVLLSIANMNHISKVQTVITHNNCDNVPTASTCINLKIRPNQITSLAKNRKSNIIIIVEMKYGKNDAVCAPAIQIQSYHE